MARIIISQSWEGLPRPHCQADMSVILQSVGAGITPGLKKMRVSAQMLEPRDAAGQSPARFEASAQRQIAQLAAHNGALIYKSDTSGPACQSWVSRQR
ncbi:hypothetical protein NDU88_002029 [Pleurodeles waltl]|uniref:Uncharacterized protein n=1 Tax=Pleurodeles waltl TaxID=8319 RepID=A0AAV7PE63_PLEWA|nr:hypothetical protein NDU88_002029 [Pleurodeles waltl]